MDEYLATMLRFVARLFQTTSRSSGTAAEHAENEIEIIQSLDISKSKTNTFLQRIQKIN